MDVHSCVKFSRKMQIVTFKHSFLTNKYINQIFAYMISTESHTPKNEEKIKHSKNMIPPPEI